MADYYVDENGIVTKKKKKNQADYVVDENGIVTKVTATKEDDEEDIAPVKTTKSKAKEEEARKLVAEKLKEKKKSDERIDFFQKPEVLDDGYDLGDGFGIVAGTVTDAALGVARGGVGMLEGVSDFILHRAADVAGIGGNRIDSQKGYLGILMLIRCGRRDRGIAISASDKLSVRVFIPRRRIYRVDFYIFQGLCIL